MFGESAFDKRDYGFAFAGMKGSAYLALVMAAKGMLSPLDAEEFNKQIRDGLSIVPDHILTDAGRDAIDNMLASITRMAEISFKPEK